MSIHLAHIALNQDDDHHKRKYRGCDQKSISQPDFAKAVTNAFAELNRASLFSFDKHDFEFMLPLTISSVISGDLKMKI